MVRSCAAFKEAGILVHAYLIYGYWDQDEEELINSADIIRQLFRHELLDSAFWHKFILTRHSRLYAEKERGLHQALRIQHSPENSFVQNDLSFEGEEKYEKYSESLEKLLSMWMNGCGLEADVEAAFPFKVKKPTVAPDFIQGLLEEYARDKIKEQRRAPELDEHLLFLGSRPIIRSGNPSTKKTLFWRWHLEDHSLILGSLEQAKKIDGLLDKISQEKMEAIGFFRELEEILGIKEATKAWRILRKSGLVTIYRPSVFHN